MKKVYILFGFSWLVISFCDLIASANIDSLNQELIESIRGQKPIKKIRQLLSAGANINAVDNDGMTVLMNGTSLGSKEVVKLLLQAGANVNAADNSGWTALMFGISSRSKEVVELLLQAGANVNAVGDKGWTALMSGVILGSKEVVELLLQAGANVNAVDNYGKTVLIYAVSLGSKEVVELLLQAGANVNAVDNNGSTAINLARSPEIKQMLMRYKAFRFIKINQIFDKEPKPEDYISDKAIIEGVTFESAVAMIDEDDEEYGTQIEAFTNDHVDWLRNPLQEAYKPFLDENNSEPLLRFFEKIEPRLLPEVASFFNSREDFLYVLNELKSHATGQVLNRLQKIIDHEEHIAKDIAARRIQ